ncbi:unnamed protein product [Closterium sp. Naga37s-1]|nr:unnamed protein product [Closterium sp. Naga37s-1]
MASVACAPTLHQQHDAVTLAALPRLPRRTTLAVCAHRLPQSSHPAALHRRNPCVQAGPLARLRGEGRRSMRACGAEAAGVAAQTTRRRRAVDGAEEEEREEEQEAAAEGEDEEEKKDEVRTFKYAPRQPNPMFHVPPSFHQSSPSSLQARLSYLLLVILPLRPLTLTPLGSPQPAPTSNPYPLSPMLLPTPHTRQAASPPAAPCLLTLAESPTAFTFQAHPHSDDPQATAFWLSSLRPVPRLTASVLLSDIESRVATIRRRRPPVTEASLHTVVFFLALGLTPSRVLDLFSRVPSLLKSRWDRDLLPKFHLLLAAGVELPSVFSALNSIPNWLRCETRGLAGVVGFLQAMGVRREKMSSIVRRAPAVLQYDANNNLWAWAEALSGLIMQEDMGDGDEEAEESEEEWGEGGGAVDGEELGVVEGERGGTAVPGIASDQESVVLAPASAGSTAGQAADAHTELTPTPASAKDAAETESQAGTGMKPEGPASISPQLQAAMERRVFGQFIEKYPRIMSNSAPFISHRVRLLCSPAFGLRLPKLLRSANLLGIKEEKLRAALAFLEREVAWSSEDLRMIVNAQPTILGLDPENLKEKVLCVTRLLDGPGYAAGAVGFAGGGAGVGNAREQQAPVTPSSAAPAVASSPAEASTTESAAAAARSRHTRSSICGPAARDAFHVYPSLLATSVSTLEDTFSHFQARFPPDAVRSLLSTYPYLLSRKWERNLGPKLDYLVEETGLDASEVLHYPLYFTHSLERRIKPRISAFQAAGYRLVSAAAGAQGGGEEGEGDGEGGEEKGWVRSRGRPSRANSGEWMRHGVLLTTLLHCTDAEFVKKFGVRLGVQRD